jgi:hypothetical protein
MARRELIQMGGKLNEYNDIQIEEQGASANQLYETVDLGISSYGRDTRVSGMQYRFPTWALTGSDIGSMGIIDSIGADYYEPIQPNITGSRVSNHFNTINYPYSGDNLMYNSSSLQSPNLLYVYTGSYGYMVEDKAPYVHDYGFRFNSTTDGLFYIGFHHLMANYLSVYGTASFIVPILESGSNYSVSLRAYTTGTGYGGATYANCQIKLGGSGSTSPVSNIITINNSSSGTGSMEVSGTADGPYLYVETYQLVGGSPSYGEVHFLDLSIRGDRRPAQVQDFTVGPLASLGLKNAKYDGCKLTATDYNVDSPDTVDKGPVITLLITDSNELIVKPTKRGTFSVG